MERGDVQLLVDVVTVTKQLSKLAELLEPWNLADRVAEAYEQLAADLDESRRDEGALTSRTLQEQQRRLARIVKGIHRVVAIFEGAPRTVRVDKLTYVLEIYAAAIASSSFRFGCDELIQFAEARVAALRAGDWEP